MIYFRLLGGKQIDMNNERSADKYADKVLKTTYNLEAAKKTFEQCIEIFRDSEKYWTQTLQKNLHSMKESQIFTELIIKKMDGIPLAPIKAEIEKQARVQDGRVKKVIFTQRTPYGFITADSGEEFFFSSRMNKSLNFKTLKGKKVEFQATLKDGKDRMQAYNIRVKEQ